MIFVVINKLDQLARYTHHLLEIAEFLAAKNVTLKIQNLGIDTETPTGKLMLTMLGAIATFERELMFERQAEGTAIAKSKGKYKGRAPIVMAKKAEVAALLAQNVHKTEIAKHLGISLSSVQRASLRQS